MKTRIGFLPSCALFTLLFAAGCGDSDNSTPSSGGDSVAPGIFAALGEVRPSASAEEMATFARGRSVAQRRFAPAEGLGPEFNVVSCGDCHERPVTSGGGARYRNFLLVRDVLPDGSSVNLGVNGVLPHFTLGAGGRTPTDPQTNLEATRNPMPFFGVGLLAEIPEAEILKRVDANDADHNGISGRANFDRGFVGRFGRKAQTVSIEGFIRGPLFNHVGISSNPLSNASKAKLPVPSAPMPSVQVEGEASSQASAQVAAPDVPLTDNDSVPDPELPEADLFDVVSFTMLVAAPQPDPPNATTQAGKARFEALACSACHVPSLQGPRGAIPAYTDLLLHEMGSELADGITMGVASGSEFRTQPLWGVGAVAPYLHDGRADTLDQAIRLHGGEAANSRDAYVALGTAAQSEVIAFLDSLGGASQYSAGLLPPAAPLPPVGTLGGPARPLSASEQARFLRGRAVFDRDVPIADGLGPLFNGDSCRACHFLPTIGGAGPADVDVTRQGHLDNGIFTAPAHGTMAHRHSTDGTRPPIDATANVFETRQTPPIFGLGLLESVADDDILANANCDDPDPTAISGCARILPNGQLGRLGWKAGVPSLAEFARDALTNEVGLTVPAIDGLTFGALVDSDGVPDPEINQADVDALVFFMQNLAPPPGQSEDATAERAGKALFEDVGCNACHIDSFVAPSGAVAYTDLLLHQVAPDGSPGIGDGSADPLEIRTPPLWGLSLTPPYMHDGRSFSVEDAIARHDAEAARSRAAFEALTAEQRAELLAFLASL